MDVMETGRDTNPIDVADDTVLIPCVSGNWLVRIIPGTCPFCVFCQLYKTPPFYTAQVTATLSVLNCTAALTGVQGRNKCTYQNMDKCTPTFTYDDANTESFMWDGTVVFQRFTGVIPVAVVNGQVLSEWFNDVEIGLSGLAYGQDAGMPCPYRILLTKESE